MKRLIIVRILYLTLSLPSLLLAETNVTENITTDTRWRISGSPYIIESDIQVYPEVTLTIEPGVEVVIKSDATLIIGGELIAVGKPAEPITFTSDQKIPQFEGTWVGIRFLESAVGASYTPAHNPQFIYDYDNNQVLLSYESGSILNYCVIEYFEFGIRAINVLPAIMNSTVRNCGVGINVESWPEIPFRKWFYFYANTVENCINGLRLGMHGPGPGWQELSHALISGNTFRNNGLPNQYRSAAVTVDGAFNCTMFFNNQIFGNSGVGISDFYKTYYNSGGLLFFEHNVISHNDQGARLGGAVAMLHNLISDNRDSYRPDVLGGGLYLAGPYGVVMNNSIQLNGVPDGGHGDGIALYPEEYNSFIIRHNNLGNSVWDMYDIDLLGSRLEGFNVPEAQCESAADMNVDAAYNSWMTINPPDHIYDYSDDQCAGSVNYQPVAASAMLPAPLRTYPTLTSPQNNEFLTNTTTISFAWQPVDGATKYILCTFGEESAESAGRKNFNRLVVVNSTTTEVVFPTAFDYGMNYIHWFIVAGNDKGWSLPSEIRKVTFSQEPVLLSGQVIDENEEPVEEVFIRSIGFYETFSDENGNYSLMPPTYNGKMTSTIWSLQKKGYVTSYSYARGALEFDMANDFTIISEEKRGEIFQSAGITYDKTKGVIAGVVVDEHDRAIKGVKVTLEPPSGWIFYLEDKHFFSRNLTATGTSGEFVILNVTPGDYRLSTDYAKLDFDTEIEVFEDAITVDALIGKTASTNDGFESDGPGSGGGGGGGGCFIDTIVSQ